MTPLTRDRLPVFANLSPDQLRDRLPAFGAARPPAWRMETDETADTARIHLYGAIGGFWGEVLASDLVPAIRDITASTIELYVNSPGGDVYDGIAIRNALRGHSARVVAVVDGLAASAATIVLTGADEIVMGNGSELMIHDAWTIVMGNAEELRAVAEDLDRICDNIAAMYADRAGGEAADWRALMRAETWYSADEAVEAGLADRTDSAASREDAAAAFDLTVFAHAGRAHAPAPGTLTPAATATHPRKDTEMNRAQLAAALAAGTINQEQHDTMLAQLEAFEAAVAATPPAPVGDAVQQTAIEAGPQWQAQTAPLTRAVDRPISLRQFAERMATEVERHSMAGRSLVDSINNSLADVVPADDAGGAFVNREDFFGEVWRAEEASRPWIDAIGTPEQMTSLKRKGWRWGKDELDEDDEPTGVELPGTPDVDEYAGNKTEVPSNEIGTKDVEFGHFRIAAGWDIDRVYFDFFEAEFWESFTRAAGANYKRKSNAKVRTRILAAATDTPTADVSFPTKGINGVLKQLRADIRSVEGAHANRVFLGSTLFDALEDLDTDHLPLWLRNADIGLGEDDEDQANVGRLRIRRDSTLGAGDSVVFDNRGWRIFERSPFWFQAVNIPHGGVDVGVFSYMRLEEHDDRVTVKRTYALA